MSVYGAGVFLILLPYFEQNCRTIISAAIPGKSAVLNVFHSEKVYPEEADYKFGFKRPFGLT